MKPVHSLCSFAFVFAAPLLAQRMPAVPAPELGIAIGSYQVQFTVEAQTPQFLGVVIASLSPDLRHYVVGLPPLLDQAVVLDWGPTTSGRFHTALSEFVFPNGIFVYAQGLALVNGAVLASDVDSFVLDVTVPPK